jgi:ATP-dependent protease ClpP protease subunit
MLGQIGDPDEYIELCHALRCARPEDKFIIRYNCPGGQVRSGNMILNAINECRALTIGIIEHDCGSMATFLFLACDTWAVSKYAEFFAHTVSSGSFGKECETFESSQFLRRQTHKRMKEEYAGFLTEDEISGLLGGRDIYLDADEIISRLEVYDEYRENNKEGEDGEDEVSLLTIVEDSVSKQFEAILKRYDLVEKVVPSPKPVSKPRVKKEKPAE